MYGDEELGIPPEEMYTKLDATDALEKAVKVFHLVSRLIKEFEV